MLVIINLEDVFVYHDISVYDLTIETINYRDDMNYRPTLLRTKTSAKISNRSHNLPSLKEDKGPIESVLVNSPFSSC